MPNDVSLRPVYAPLNNVRSELEKEGPRDLQELKHILLNSLKDTCFKLGNILNDYSLKLGTARERYKHKMLAAFFSTTLLD
jgi:hypothetical protein